jgi:hypothetical protein
MKKFTTLTLGALSLVALASACSVDVAETPTEETATNQQGIVCSNDQATFSIMAGMAVAASNESRRWLPARDLECSGWDVGVDVLPAGAPDGLADYPGKCIRGPYVVPAGQPGAGQQQWRMGVSPKGHARCPNHNCRNMMGLLKLQDDSWNGEIFSGQPLSAGVLRDRLKSYWERQFVCVNRPDNHMADNCPVEYHDLTFTSKGTGTNTCVGGLDFWYHASKQGSNPPVNLQYPAQLKNMLIWAGGSDNPFLSFDVQGDDVKIDPGPGTNDGSTGTSGSCPIVSYNATLNKCGQLYSSTNLVGTCCTCNGVNKTFVNGTATDYYKCL